LVASALVACSTSPNYEAEFEAATLQVQELEDRVKELEEALESANEEIQEANEQLAEIEIAAYGSCDYLKVLAAGAHEVDEVPVP
jgi:DNA-binding protein YbaB